MRFLEILSNRTGPVVSFEVFPPKSEAGVSQLEGVLRELAKLHPDFMTVTYGAFGTTQTRTLELASYIKTQLALETACHLTCVGSSRGDIDLILQNIQQAGIENIVALRGDPPKGQDEFRPAPDGFAHASELVAHIRQLPVRISQAGIAVAGYPEKHLEAPDMDTDLGHLKHKVDAGADLVITQLFYDNQDYFSFVRMARDWGIAQPIIPGLLPILSVRQIRRITAMCGSKIPPDLQEELRAAGDDDQKAIDVGVRRCVRQATELLDHQVPGIHFYVLNRSDHMSRIMQALPAR